MELEFLRKEVSKLKSMVGVSPINCFIYFRRNLKMKSQEMNRAGNLSLQKRKKLQSFLRLKHLQEEVLVHQFPLRFSVNGTKKVISRHLNTTRLHK
jgi:hypothetical protein